MHRCLSASLGSVLTLLTIPVLAQTQRLTQTNLEVGTILATDQTPFWLRANQYGIVPLKGPVLRLQANIRSDYRLADSTGYRPKVDWGYAVDGVVNVGVTNQFFLPEAHIKGRLGAFELYVGRRREIVGLVDTLLTTGAYAWSGNALPIPKIQIALPVFTAVPFTKGVISVMGAYNHGWFENNGRIVTDSYLHQKYVYGRLGKPTWRFRLYGGFNHQVVWSGKAPPGVLSPNLSNNGVLPSGIKYYPAVVFGTRGQGDRSDPNVTSFEDNRIGNHLGSLDVAADIDFSGWNLLAYRQFVYDDGSLFYGTNLADGLNGLRLKSHRQPAGEAFFLRQITAEFLYTESQGGDAFVVDDPDQRGRDNYFNQGQFIDGWQYFHHTIGTPFLTPQGEARPSLPNPIGITNNRVSAVHVGMAGLLFNRIEVTSKLSFSQNLGTYGKPFPTQPRQFSGLITAALPTTLFGGTLLNGSLGVDLGGLLPSSVGVYLGLRKTGLLSSRSASDQRSSNVSPRYLQR
ncbi:capsule assembly Wzi family protein [Fibrella aquatilis]|uniref:Capsule assembly Wzi family protein n=1 Tax=Fibrella aquatilis TaxID=2817059 RepID=A0A939G6K8_9BACT|nr:capsule assembly Wzi family protein [Fibrella aquatilis]MBO0933357.1 hypothetical protein [Fibrella aquatilis]